MEILRRDGGKVEMPLFFDKTREFEDQTEKEIEAVVCGRFHCVLTRFCGTPIHDQLNLIEQAYRAHVLYISNRTE